MKKSKHRKIKLQLFAALILCFVVVAFFVFDRKIKPLFAAAAETRVRSLASKQMNTAVLDNMNDLNYDDLITIVKDNDGRISMLQGNSAVMNHLGMTVALDAQEKIMEAGEQGISVRLGTASGISFLYNRGPAIRIMITPAGSVTSTFLSKFEDAGINQTLHRINLKLDAKVRVVMSGSTLDTFDISCEIPVAESLIVGVVPTTYVNVPSNEDALNLVP